jgi:hypothetical protein
MWLFGSIRFARPNLETIVAYNWVHHLRQYEWNAMSEKDAASDARRQNTDPLRREKLLRFLESDAPAWKDADHPELADGTAAWVRRLRQGESKTRLQKKRRSSRA